MSKNKLITYLALIAFVAKNFNFVASTDFILSQKSLNKVQTKASEPKIAPLNKLFNKLSKKKLFQIGFGGCFGIAIAFDCYLAINHAKEFGYCCHCSEINFKKLDDLFTEPAHVYWKKVFQITPSHTPEWYEYHAEYWRCQYCEILPENEEGRIKKRKNFLKYAAQCYFSASDAYKKKGFDREINMAKAYETEAKSYECLAKLQILEGKKLDIFDKLEAAWKNCGHAKKSYLCYSKARLSRATAFIVQSEKSSSITAMNWYSVSVDNFLCKTFSKTNWLAFTAYVLANCEECSTDISSMDENRLANAWLKAAKLDLQCADYSKNIATKAIYTAFAAECYWRAKRKLSYDLL
jgi:hypothetical protein